MEKTLQTETLKIRLYELTLQFVHKYQPRYYKQYRGQHEDLAIDFYSQFLTPKSRVEGKEETLLDKFNPEITKLEYLVKVSVQRMLIDRSRKDCHRHLSIDTMVDEYGDMMIQTFGLSTEDYDTTVDEHEFSEDEILAICAKFETLDRKTQERIYKQYSEVRGVLAPSYQDLFERVMPAPEEDEIEEDSQAQMYIEIINEEGIFSIVPVQQITSKTICVAHQGEIRNFNRFNGEARGKNYRNWTVCVNEIDTIRSIETYKSEMSRNEFINEFCMIESY